jgi:hypothetical protein
MDSETDTPHLALFRELSSSLTLERAMPLTFFKCPRPNCDRVLKNQSGLTQHLSWHDLAAHAAVLAGVQPAPVPSANAPAPQAGDMDMGEEEEEDEDMEMSQRGEDVHNGFYDDHPREPEAMEARRARGPVIERHPVLNGASVHNHSVLWWMLTCFSGTKYKRDGSPALPGDLPQPPLFEDPNNPYFPFDDRIQYELARLLFAEAKLPQVHIEKLFSLWEAHALKSASSAPFSSLKDMLDHVDAITLGDTPWQSFNVCYTGEVPEEGAPLWMSEKYECHFRDPRALLADMLADRSFNGHFDDAAYIKINAQGERVRKDFMSANFAWLSSVRSRSCLQKDVGL